jgi:hypothetical protein
MSSTPSSLCERFKTQYRLGMSACPHTWSSGLKSQLNLGYSACYVGCVIVDIPSERSALTRVLVLGGSGMLGHKLCQVFGPIFDTYARS